MKALSLLLKGGALRDASLPGVTLLIVFLVVPVPAWLLDVGFIGNIALSLVVLMVALGTNKALDFSSFPTVLLFATLLRLALKVASTRVVLVAGHEGAGAAGQVIEAFGQALIGARMVQSLAGPVDPLLVLTLDPAIEAMLADAVRLAVPGEPVLLFDPDLSQRLARAVHDAAEPLIAAGHRVALVTAPASRRPLARLIGMGSRDLAVLSFPAIPETRAVEVVGIIGAPAPADPASGPSALGAPTMSAPAPHPDLEPA